MTGEVWGGVWSWGVGGCLVRRGWAGGGTQNPLKMATAAFGMHPTGMHSCCYLNVHNAHLNLLSPISG